MDRQPTASRQLLYAYQKPMQAILRQQFPVFDAEIVGDAVSDALLALIQKPERYDAEQGTVLNYLLHIGKHKLLDSLRAYQRKNSVDYVGGNVELALVEEKQYREGNFAEPMDREDSLPSEVEQLLQAILPDPRDRKIWELICQGRTSVADYATLLGITHLAISEQKAEVKRQRDRVQKKVRRKQDAFRSYLNV